MPQQKKAAPATCRADDKEIEAYQKLIRLAKSSPIPDEETLANAGLFLTRSLWGRMLFLHDMFTKVLATHGVIMEFGVRWGQNIAMFSSFRSLYEPYNMSRKIVGFDTFKGFPSVSSLDNSRSSAGDLAVPEGYPKTLTEILDAHEQLAPRGNVKKYELVQGDVMETLPGYLDQHPETIIALAFFDLDLYEPTKKCLETIKPYLAKNSIIAFDQLALSDFPGETVALREVWGTNEYAIVRSPYAPQMSYITFDRPS